MIADLMFPYEVNTVARYRESRLGDGLELFRTDNCASATGVPSLARRVPPAMVGLWSSTGATPPEAGLRPPGGRAPIELICFAVAS